MNVVIRVDASRRIGLGHLARCRTLAAALRDAGARVRFICRQHPGHQIDALRAEGYRVSALPAPPQRHAADGDYAAWLGVSQDQDAAETIAALTPESPPEAMTERGVDIFSADWLIVDHYGLDSEWARLLRAHARKIMVVDDLADRPHDCDLLLDQNFSMGAAPRYGDLLPPSAQTLLGPRYALLRPEYGQTRSGLRGRDGHLRRVLVFFGGTDPENLTGSVLEALSDPTLAHLGVDIIVGANNPNAHELTAQAAKRPGTKLHLPRPHLADLMAAADLAIGAGGATTWERCCLGLPSVVVSIAENQRPACEALAAAGVIDYLGHHDQASVDMIRVALRRISQHSADLTNLSRAGLDLVDGRGVERVTHVMQSLQSVP
jgi:UDP-2,4-diacetamido-2,4,6-trideoxy-beta-L-altropyranose hydrolase